MGRIVSFISQFDRVVKTRARSMVRKEKGLIIGWRRSIARIDARLVSAGPSARMGRPGKANVSRTGPESARALEKKNTHSLARAHVENCFPAPASDSCKIERLLRP